MLNESLLYICNGRNDLVPEKSLALYQHHIKKWQPTLDEELEVGMVLQPINVQDDLITYEGDDGKLYSIFIDWQICSEMMYGFLTMNRLHGFKLPHLEDITMKSIESSINENEWVFAKTMPKNPHYYVVRKKWKGEVSFNDFALFIRKHGYNEKFKGWTYRLFQVGDYYYWSMGAPLSLTVVINRKLIV